MDIGKQTRVEMDKYDTLQKIVDQLEYCNYEIDGRRLTNNIAFLRLKEMAKEQQHISDTPTLSAVPSAKCKEIIKQTGEMFYLFKEENIGRYELTQARVALFKAIDYLEEFERRRGIAG